MLDKEIKNIIEFTVREMLNNISWIDDYEKIVNQVTEGILYNLKIKWNNG